MNVTIIQPPLVQLNTPYPSGAYLKSFFENFTSVGDVRWLDLSNALFHKIFSSVGLRKLFALSEADALKLTKSADENTAYQIRRYISLQDALCFWIDRIVEIACGGKSAREYTHEFVRSPFVPRGNRMENFLYNLGRDVTSDDAQILASLALADLADYINTVFDENFRLISYAERLGTSEASFDNVIDGLKSPVLTEFYDDVLEETIGVKTGSPIRTGNLGQPDGLFLISVPFPGCFEAAVYTAKKIREMYDKNAIIAVGGGFCNTELRNIQETRFFDYFDFISYDMGYGSYLNFLDEIENLEKQGKCNTKCLKNDVFGEFVGRKLYKIKYLYKGEIVGDCDTKCPISDIPMGAVDYASLETEICKRLVPDYTSIDFSKYPRLADDTNPMHRIWNDGAWLKAYLAHGCYWHRCAFCDTTLEYVNRFCECDCRALCDGLTKQAEATGVWGIHFVDEACPPSALLEFGLQNCLNNKSTGKKLTYWGNIRFEKTFTRDLANFLSYSGLTAVSAGIEIATGDGLESVNKGTTIENIVKACCAFKEAGILVHSYMIFGFYNQSEQDLINSMETLRQLFKHGLLDSAFWHKFTLTLHSTVYKEWQEGKHKNLRPLVYDRVRDAHEKNKLHSGKQTDREVSGVVRFAENDLRFEGEEKSEKYSEPLNTALDSWMHGENLDVSVNEWFDFKMPVPTIGHKYIKKMIDAYERERDAAWKAKPTERDRFVWLGGKVIECGEKITWQFMSEEFECVCDNAAEVAEILNELKPESADAMCSERQKRFLKICDEKIFETLRSSGLCKI